MPLAVGDLSLEVIVGDLRPLLTPRESRHDRLGFWLGKFIYKKEKENLANLSLKGPWST